MLKNGRVTANFNADMHAIFLDAKSTDELICFGSSNRSVQCLVSANPSVILRLQSPNEKLLHFLADLRSQYYELRSQRKSPQKTNPKSEISVSLSKR